MQLSSAQRQAIDRSFRQYLLETGDSFAQTILQEEILDAIEGGALGITADAADIDSLALGGGHFTYNPDGTSGLDFAFEAGRFHNGYSEVTVSAGTVTLSPSTTNYVEVDRSGTVTANTTAFTAGLLPLYVVVTGVSSVSTVTSKKPLMTLIGPNGVNGLMLSTPGKTKEIEIEIGDLSATGTQICLLPGVAGTITGIRFVNGTSVTQSDSDYWTFAAINKGAAGSGSTAVLDTGAGNTTKTTGGAALTNYVARALTLHGTSGNLDFAANDALLFTITKTGSATALTKIKIRVDVTFAT